MADYEPWQPAESFDAMSEAIRRGIADVFIEVERAAIFQEMDGRQQLECCIAGGLVGVIGMVLGRVKAEHREAVMEAVVAYLPQAKDQVITMLATVETEIARPPGP